MEINFKKLKSKIIKLLPEPLKPQKYQPPKPKPKPRVKPKVIPKRPVPLPRSSPYQKPIEVKKFIDKITPFYKPEAIEAFDKILKDKKSLRVKITEKKKSFKK